MKAIRIQGLTKHYGAHQVLRGIDLELAQGELLALLGPSGCGKSTTLQMLAGFDQPTDGQIWIGDRQVSGAGVMVPPERRNISLVFQNYAVWPHMTVFENVAYGLQVRKVARTELAQRVKRALDTVRLTALAQRYPSELSGGQQQRASWRGRWWSSPTSSCWTNPCPISMRICARRCATRSARCTIFWA